MADLRIHISGLELKNPVICSSGEHTMTAEGIRAAIASGVGAVVAKSVNESLAAKSQLDKTDYRMVGTDWKPVPWDFNAPQDASIFCRSGLIQKSFEDWMQELIFLDREAAVADCYVIPSLILSDLDQCVAYAQVVQKMGFRVLEVNIGAPHGDEAAKGAIVLERDASRIETIVKRLREAVSIPLWIKLTGQSENPALLADAARNSGADAVVLMGRFMGFLPDLETHKPLLNTSAALGGAWALPLTARCVALARKRLGPQFPILATNGARSGLDVARFLLSGAYAVELASLVLMRGYSALTQCVEELSDYLDAQGISAKQLTGLAADQLQSYAEQVDRPEIWRKFCPPVEAGARSENPY
ncbi:dihydroorotate dehydrogenase [Ottowia thiooxydans]|uniref:dihydroorotate dehydrogenase n=1 Tax=Ottowia thiooxydans TaxID=219182 RepID=UPI000410FD96|nr:dihydroorotate dehydrogenase [Ottowia thiooxydans]